MFAKTDISEMIMNPFRKIADEWFLLTAGNSEGNYNTMTASWGGMGTIWGKSAITAYVRHSRKTFELMEANEYFSLSFLPKECRSILSFCGSKSGRDCNKAKETGLIPVFDEKTTYFEQAELVFICKKLYSSDLSADGLTADFVKSFYEKDALHRQYIGEIVEILRKS